MTPERVLEIADKHADVFYEEDYTLGKRVDVAMKKAIQEALEEENKWFYPEKGEFPDDKAPIIYIAHGSESIELGVKDCQMLTWPCKKSYRFNVVKCWRYVPEVPGEVK